MMPNEEIEAAVAEYTKKKQREYKRKYRERNRAHILEYQREWYDRNRDHCKAYMRKYYRENKDKILEYQRACRARKKAEKSHRGAVTPSVEREKSTDKV